jgi:hypothetical protein
MSMILGRTVACGVAFIMSLGVATAEDKQTMTLGPVTVVAPKEWKLKEPASRIIAYEFAAPKVGDDKEDGRFLFWAAGAVGGTAQMNIDRWYGQFTQDDGSDTKKRGKVEKKSIASQTVHLVDISGTYKEPRGPMAQTVSRKDYRMLGAIIETPRSILFLKFYGPKRTIAENEKAFRQMIEEMKAR